MGKKVVFCCPFLVAPTRPLLASLEASVPYIEAAGWSHEFVVEVSNPYISIARATMLRKALDAKADVVVFLDYDLSWRPQDLVTLIETEGDYVCGTYRFKKDEVEYMGTLTTDAFGYPIVNTDGTLIATRAPAGFMKITRGTVNKLMKAHPELVYGELCHPSFDFFNHGAHEGVIWGEDYAASRRWCDLGGSIKVIPDLSITHHSSDVAYPGNFHEFLMACPGGVNHAK